MLLLAALLTIGLLPAVPAAAQEPIPGYWSMNTMPRKIMRGGKAYLLTVGAYDAGGGPATVNITLSKTLDPAGVRTSTQSHTFSFDLDDEGVFIHNAPKLGEAKVNTNGDIAPWGSFLLRFDRTSPLTNTCRSGGKDLSAKGDVTGNFTFKTGTKRFGTITEEPKRATLYYSDGQCDYTGTDEGYCPPSSEGMYGSREGDGLSLYASRVNGYKGVSVSMGYFKEIKGGGTRSSHIMARLPSTKLELANNLSSGRIRGAKKTYLSGAGNFAKDGPLQEFKQPCYRKPGTVDQASRPGVLRGDFKAAFWLGGAKSLSSGRMPDANADRTTR